VVVEVLPAAAGTLLAEVYFQMGAPPAPARKAVVPETTRLGRPVTLGAIAAGKQLVVLGAMTLSLRTATTTSEAPGLTSAKSPSNVPALFRQRATSPAPGFFTSFASVLSVSAT
jgi:hypothetical protein